MSNEQAIQDVAMIARNAIDKIIEMKKQAPRDDTALLRQALEALQFKNVVNMCGKYSVVDPVKAAEAIIALRKRLEEKA